MRNKKLFLDALHMMIYSWGGDTPPESFWALAIFKDFYESETGERLEVGEYDEDGDWANRVIEAINNTITDNNEPEDQGLTEELKNFKRFIK